MKKFPVEETQEFEQQQAPGRAVTISRRAADRLRSGHLWVYRSDMERPAPGAGEIDLERGALVSVLDARGSSFGTGIYSSASQIAVRMVSGRFSLTREEYLEDTRQRIIAALTLRRELAPESSDNAGRLIFSEADGLPGIVADKYNDLIVLQLLTQGTAQDDLRRLLASVVAQELEVSTIVERSDARIRELEDLAAPRSEALYTRDESQVRLATQFAINGLMFHFDAEAGQKTGAFLDQRLNYAAAARYARGRALDVCTYQGGFALHMAERCERVTGVDASRAALEVADRNLQLNPQLGGVVDWIEADAFELLREFERAGEQFETIVLDPPAFAKSKRAAEGAMRGYKELNLRAIKMLRPGGTLVTCSCSHHVSLGDFMLAVTAAASDAKKKVQLLETRGAATDHPAVLTLPETEYLKCLICRVN